MGPTRGEGANDLDVARPIFAVMLLGELVEQVLELLEAELALMDHVEARQEQADAHASRFLRPRRQRHGRLAEHRKDIVRTEAADAMAPQELLNRSPLQPGRRVRTVHAPDEIPVAFRAGR